MREQICRRAVAERLVGAPVIVKAEVAVQRLEQIGPAGEIAGVDEFVLQAAPQALDESVVQGTAPSIHADGDVALLQWRQKVGRGELRALIGVPDFRLPKRNAASSAAKQQPVSIVLESSQLSTKRLNQSITATR